MEIRFPFLEEKEMNAFLLNKTQYYIDRSNEYSMLLKYITGDHEDFVLMGEKGNGQPLLALSSLSGDGKTMLLAKFVLDIEVSSKETHSRNCLSLSRYHARNKGRTKLSFIITLLMGRIKMVVISY